ncbi:hypothetical protein EZV62_016373 [Acer yangbiense]|uniref:6-phosphogluconate dehydrogenase NADP-binding domain-containing protein n=1 Tax=Acer yangbiense TaxID=1000413 RepID=A0A5C7HNZ0_9ROSI|nr:hypothetical protein EZV62_016373 [Acer yangbiense]
MKCYICPPNQKKKKKNLLYRITSKSDKGFPIYVYNRTTSKVDETLDRDHREGDLLLTGQHTSRDFVLSIKQPRSVISLIKAGSPVDQTIAALSEHMSPGDCNIDAGNEWYENIERHIYDFL